jgi:fucose permease
MLGVLFFLYYEEEIGFSGWISSYAVILGIDNKEGATKNPFLFWISITLARFLLAGLLERLHIN